MAGKVRLVAGADVPSAGAYATDYADGSNVGGGTWREQSGNWLPRIDSPNSPHQVERENERARSRDLISKDAIAAGAIHVNDDHVIGTGLSMRSKLDHIALGLTKAQARKWQNDVNRRFEMWASSPNADVAGRLDFYDQQKLALRSMLASGDVLALLTDVDVPGWPYRFAVQLIEADRVCNPKRKQDAPGSLVSGIEMDSRGRPVAAHIAKYHPGLTAMWREQDWQRIPFVGARSQRRNLLHIFESSRPDQVRGTCYLAPVIGKLKVLGR